MKQTSGVLWLRNLSQLLMWKTKAMNLGVLVPLLWSLVPSPSESWCQPKPRIQISGIPITNCQPIFQSDGNLKRAQIDANSNFDRNVCVCVTKWEFPQFPKDLRYVSMLMAISWCQMRSSVKHLLFLPRPWSAGGSLPGVIPHGGV